MFVARRIGLCKQLIAIQGETISGAAYAICV